MSRVVTACHPASDAGFQDRVRHVVAQDRLDLGSRAGIAHMEAMLREAYPMATVAKHDGVWTGGCRRTLVLDVFRDGWPVEPDPDVRWVEAVYDLGGRSAYTEAARVLGEGPLAESVVAQAFRDVCRSHPAAPSVEEAATSVRASALRLARAARDSSDSPSEPMDEGVVPEPPLDTTLRQGTRCRSLSRGAVTHMLSAQRAALELAMLEGLKVSAIAERMQMTTSIVHRHLRDALLAVSSGVRPSAAVTLAHWREARRDWARLPDSHPARAQRALAVAHTWLDFQVASNVLEHDTVVVVTGADRRFVAATANAGQLFGRPSIIGLRIDDVTADYAKPLVADLWALFDANGSMHGDYDCDRPGQAPIRIPFHGVFAQPLPELQVGYLQAPGVPTDLVAATG